MAVPSNILQNVQTYQRAELAWMLNTFALVANTNKRFKDFENLTANLGDTVTFDLAPRYISYNGLVVTTQSSTQRVQSLVASQAANVSSAYTDQQFIFNARTYMERFGMSAMMELGTLIETDISKNITSSVIINDPQNPNFGQVQSGSGPFRFYYGGLTSNVLSPINSYGQLAQAIANFKDFGAAQTKLQGILPSVNIPSIVNSGLNQFVWDRNEDIAKTWMLGEFSECEWLRSNLLPIHISGSVGNAASPNNVLTLVSTNDPSGTNVTQITFSGAVANDPNAIKAGDMFEFNDGVTGHPNLRYLTFIGHVPSSQKVQFRSNTNVAADGSGNVTISITPALVSVQNENQNLNATLTAGMQVTVMPSHRAGLIHSGDQFYLAMPVLPDQDPYNTVSQVDKESGVSIRHYWGSQGFGQNTRAYVRDIIWGSTLVPENSMRVLFPL